MSIDEAIELLQARKGSVRCGELVATLRSLGFVVESRAKSPSHYTFYHRTRGRTIFGNFNCGHGKNPVPKAPYITNVIRVLEALRNELRSE